MEKLISALKELNQKIADINSTFGALIQDLAKIEQPSIWGNEQDEKNTTQEDR